MKMSKRLKIGPELQLWVPKTVINRHPVHLSGKIKFNHLDIKVVKPINYQ